MGQDQSFPLLSGFSRQEISRLEKRFQKLDIDFSGTISLREFLVVPELQNNPLLSRVVDVFDSDQSGEIDFKEFVIALSQFAAVQDNSDSKLEFIFKIYDMDRDGYISNGELFKVLKMMVGKNLTNWQLQQIVDRTIVYLDKDDDGKISFDEFKHLVKEGSKLAKVTNVMSVEV
eukprot:maker-scaffold1553_size35894-snap-gene-0.9 protein:Tk09743 transcript:maker-scaffold1553_size35894-snap-gene-0.9-mRNA-1 annotation:"calcineurin subunit b isoform 1"